MEEDFWRKKFMEKNVFLEKKICDLPQKTTYMENNRDKTTWIIFSLLWPYLMLVLPQCNFYFYFSKL